jgi:hypothetical protein
MKEILIQRIESMAENGTKIETEKKIKINGKYGKDKRLRQRSVL